MLKINMTIPLFANGVIDNEAKEIPLTDERAVEMACENMNWQADDTYFDATFEILVNGELFHENYTTDAHGTWWQLMNAIEAPGKHEVCFLDSPLGDLDVIHENKYTLEYVHIDYVWGEDNYLISYSKKMVTSEQLPKDVVETVIRDGFKQFAEFMLNNDIPIATAYKEELRQRLEGN